MAISHSDSSDYIVAAASIIATVRLSRPISFSPPLHLPVTAQRQSATWHPEETSVLPNICGYLTKKKI